LGYSLIGILNKTKNDKSNIYYHFFFPETQEVIDQLKTNFGIERNQIFFHNISFKKPLNYIELKKIFSKVHYVINVTGGDSFSDIYGKKWFIRNSMPKIISILFKKKLILAPQTYGPFESFIGKKISSFIFNNKNTI